jgi:hypothetical protein
MLSKFSLKNNIKIHTIIVLGADMVRRTIAIDLTKKHNVTLANFSQEALKPFDLVVCAVPGFLGFENPKNHY